MPRPVGVARAAAPGRRWLTTLAGTSLAAVLAGWPVMLAGNASPGPKGVSAVLTAMQRPQARVLNPGPPTGLTATAGNGQADPVLAGAYLRRRRGDHRL